MRRYVSVVLLVALALLVFAPAALADSHKMMEDEMMMSSASASASAMSSASASAMMEEDMMMEEEMMGSASASASALPTTGGPQILPLLSVAALAVVVGSGLVAARLVRSNS